MKSIFLIGDFNSNNGPANANKSFLASMLQNNTIKYTKETGIIYRIFEIITGIFTTDVSIICSASDVNYIAVMIAKLFQKKILYLMHGHGSEEYLLNTGRKDRKYRSLYLYERFIFSHTDKTICVSKKFMDDMKSRCPQFKNKFYYIYNVVNIDRLKQYAKQVSNRKKTDKRYVLSVGGGIPLKNNIVVAEAIKLLREKTKKQLKYIVIGPLQKDGEQIKKYDFVEYYERLPHDKVIELMGNAEIYVQNSTYETFGLAIIEALYSGCSILFSKNIGCGNLFPNLKEDDLINNVENEEEIMKKLMKILNIPNNKRLLKDFNEYEISKESASIKMNEIIGT